MTDCSHLIKEGGEEEKKPFLVKGDTKPEEAQALMDRMIYISNLIEQVTFNVSLTFYREPSHF